MPPISGEAATPGRFIPSAAGPVATPVAGATRTTAACAPRAVIPPVGEGEIGPHAGETRGVHALRRPGDDRLVDAELESAGLRHRVVEEVGRRLPRDAEQRGRVGDRRPRSAGPDRRRRTGPAKHSWSRWAARRRTCRSGSACRRRRRPAPCRRQRRFRASRRGRHAPGPSGRRRRRLRSRPRPASASTSAGPSMAPASASSAAASVPPSVEPKSNFIVALPRAMTDADVSTVFVSPPPVALRGAFQHDLVPGGQRQADVIPAGGGVPGIDRDDDVAAGVADADLIVARIGSHERRAAGRAA